MAYASKKGDALGVQRNSQPFSNEMASQRTTAPAMSYDQKSAFDEWPDLHQKLNQIRQRRYDAQTKPNLSYAILNNLILKSQEK